MTNAEKARELCKLYQANRASLFQHLLAMAEWKDEQHEQENKWIDVSDELPPFVTTEDGSQYSKQVLCKEECGSYCVARFVRWHTGHYMWLDSADEQPNVKYWREIKD